MPSPPRTPTRRPKSAALDSPVTSPTSRGTHHQQSGKRSSRKYSLRSIPSPSILQRTTSHESNTEIEAFNGFGDVVRSEGGLGNLADELAEAWDGDHSATIDSPPTLQKSPPHGDGWDNAAPNGDSRGRPIFHIYHEVETKATRNTNTSSFDSRSLSPEKQSVRTKSQRQLSQTSDYDGSDYGDNSDLEGVCGISSSLVARMDAVEGLARRGAEVNGSETDKVILRLTDMLKDLKSQAFMETDITRLTTSQMAITTHLAHQTRLVQNLSHSLFSPFSTPLDSSTADSLLPLLVSTVELIPKPYSQPLSSLHNLHSSTSDILCTLSTLADSLHMMRQTSSLANRKLKAARDMVDDFRREANAREEGIRWIETGNWQERLEAKECARVCKDVVRGFEGLCIDWQQRLTEFPEKASGVEVGAG